MIDDAFKEVIAGNQGCAVIMAGSDSDALHIENIVKSIEKYEVPYQVRIGSAHKQAGDVVDLVREYNNIGGLICYISVAGGTDALSGILSFHAFGFVISCPPDTRYADKEKYANDFNETCLRNPPGSSNAYIARPENVGKAVAQMFAGVNPRFRELLMRENEKKIQSLEKADAEFQSKYNKK